MVTNVYTQNGQKLIDISPYLEKRTAVWPGDTELKRKTLLSLVDGNNIELSTLESTVHIGAHADAPSHFEKEGETIGNVDLSPYIGPSYVLPIEYTSLITPKHIEKLYSLRPPRVLFRSSSFPWQKPFTENFTAVAPETIACLSTWGCVLIGVDTPSLDPFSCKDLLAHKALHHFGMRNLEGLILDHVEEGWYELIALPLKLKEFDASPVRAVLRPLPDGSTQI